MAPVNPPDPLGGLAVPAQIRCPHRGCTWSWSTVPITYPQDGVRPDHYLSLLHARTAQFLNLAGGLTAHLGRVDHAQITEPEPTLTTYQVAESLTQLTHGNGTGDLPVEIRVYDDHNNVYHGMVEEVLPVYTDNKLNRILITNKPEPKDQPF